MITELIISSQQQLNQQQLNLLATTIVESHLSESAQVESHLVVSVSWLEQATNTVIITKPKMYFFIICF
jgi:hypothetical protein